MSKKKPKKNSPPNEEALKEEIKDSLTEIVRELYAEVERVHGDRLYSVLQRTVELKDGHDKTVLECGQIIDRLAAIEARLAGCQKVEPKTWIGRLHRNRWFCFPWCRWWS